MLSEVDLLLRITVMLAVKITGRTSGSFTISKLPSEGAWQRLQSISTRKSFAAWGGRPVGFRLISWNLLIIIYITILVYAISGQ